MPTRARIGVVGVGTVLRLDLGRIVIRFLPGSRDFSLFQSNENGSGAYPVSHLVGPLFLGKTTLV
jgi:hypothetical protein